MTLSDLEGSVYKYLYENLEIPHGVKIIEDITLENYDGLQRWVVIDSLTGTDGPQPKEFFYLHAAVQHGQMHSKKDLTALVDLVRSLVNEGVVIPVYNIDTFAYLGECEVTETSRSPVFLHPNGGLFRSITVGLVYQAEPA